MLYTNNISIAARVSLLEDLSVAFGKDREYWIEQLLSIEPLKTAVDEVDKTQKALSSYNEEVPLIEGRKPLGLFRVSLPYNNPLYSFVLYSCGIALPGNEVIIRASKLTAHLVHEFYEKYISYFKAIGIKLYTGTGNAFISDAISQNDSGGLLFAGTYENVSSILNKFPRNQRLIYCGPGINPFIVGTEVNNISQVVELAIASRIYNSGQDCLCSERFLIHEKVYDEFCSELVKQVQRLKVGDFGDRTVDLFPPVPGIQKHTSALFQRILAEGNSLYIHKNAVGAILAVFEVALNSEALNLEKFASIFTIAKYKNNNDLVQAANFPYKFGATITCGANKKTFCDYPHLSTTSTVIQEESINAHVPFGGRERSGFSSMKGESVDGAILYSIESSIPINKTPSEL